MNQSYPPQWTEMRRTKAEAAAATTPMTLSERELGILKTMTTPLVDSSKPKYCRKRVHFSNTVLFRSNPTTLTVEEIQASWYKGKEKLAMKQEYRSSTTFRGLAAARQRRIQRTLVFAEQERQKVCGQQDAAAIAQIAISVSGICQQRALCQGVMDQERKTMDLFCHFLTAFWILCWMTLGYEYSDAKYDKK